METCKGFGDWLACLRCPNICTKMCPIEKENVMEELRQRLHLLERSDKHRSLYFDGNTGLRK